MRTLSIVGCSIPLVGAVLLLAGCAAPDYAAQQVAYDNERASACQLMLRVASTSSDSLRVLLRDMEPAAGSSHKSCAQFIAIVGTPAQNETSAKRAGESRASAASDPMERVP